MTDFTRPVLNNLDQVTVIRLLNKVPKTPGAMTLTASKMLTENQKRIEDVNDLRKQRDILPLGQDDEFMKTWDAIQAACDANNAHTVVKLSIAENIRLTKEINIHRRILGMELMKVYRN